MITNIYDSSSNCPLAFLCFLLLCKRVSYTKNTAIQQVCGLYRHTKISKSILAAVSVDAIKCLALISTYFLVNTVEQGFFPVTNTITLQGVNLRKHLKLYICAKQCCLFSFKAFIVVAILSFFQILSSDIDFCTPHLIIVP